MDENNSVSSQTLNFNANKVRWLADSQLTPTDTLVLGSGENVVSDTNLKKPRNVDNVSDRTY